MAHMFDALESHRAGRLRFDSVALYSLIATCTQHMLPRPRT